MLLFRDILTGDELFTDSYNLREVDDIAYEVDCAMINIATGEINIGANPSAEEGAEESAEDANAEMKNNVVHSQRLASTSFDKKSYMTHIKKYMKAVKAKLQETNPDRVPIFEKEAPAFIKKVLGNFGDYEFYVGESMDPDGMAALLNYREDGVTPFFTFFKDGLVSEKI